MVQKLKLATSSVKMRLQLTITSRRFSNLALALFSYSIGELRGIVQHACESIMKKELKKGEVKSKMFKPKPTMLLES